MSRTETWCVEVSYCFERAPGKKVLLAAPAISLSRLEEGRAKEIYLYYYPEPRNVLREKLREKGVPEDVVDTYLKIISEHSIFLDDGEADE